MKQNQTRVDEPSTDQHATQSGQPYVFEHEFGGSARLTTTLAHALADVAGVDVTDAEFTLSDYVDPEALDRLFKPRADDTPRLGGHLSFTAWGCQVTVYSDGRITVVPPQRARSR